MGSRVQLVILVPQQPATFVIIKGKLPSLCASMLIFPVSSVTLFTSIDPRFTSVGENRMKGLAFFISSSLGSWANRPMDSTILKKVSNVLFIVLVNFLVVR